MDEIKTCRHCRKQYRRTQKIAKKGWQGCCSHFCFTRAEPLPVAEGPYDKKLRPIEVGTRKSVKRAARHQNQGLYKDPRWLELRYDVLSKYGRRCMLCGKEGGQLHVDHIIPKSKRPDLAFVFDNLQVLCRDCNCGKSNRDSRDFRPKSGPGMPESVIFWIAPEK